MMGTRLRSAPPPFVEMPSAGRIASSRSIGLALHSLGVSDWLRGVSDWLRGVSTGYMCQVCQPCRSISVWVSREWLKMAARTTVRTRPLLLGAAPRLQGNAVVRRDDSGVGRRAALAATADAAWATAAILCYVLCEVFLPCCEIEIRDGEVEGEGGRNGRELGR
jgi:hypothetical protein